ncbi:MAG: DNA topoisomerase IV subunit B [Bdellovibrionota bacterium]
MSKKYTAEDIEVLEGLEPVRKRPGMFIAGTDTPAGLHQLVFEILDNSVDEAMNGHADRIEVTLHADGTSVTVTDNGRGIPVENHPVHKKPALELILTTLHAGGKFSDKNYQTAGGLHGVGSSVVNALSETLVATVRRDGKEYQQTFSRGKTTSGLKVTNKSARGTGTTIFFRPDADIFPTIQFQSSILKQTMQSRAYLNPGLRILFTDEAKHQTEEYYYPDGIRAYLKQLIEEKKAKVIGEEPFFIERKEEIEVSVALVWTESTREDFYSYANGIFTGDGGSHEIGAKAGIAKAVRNYIAVHDVNLKGVKLGAEDIREGIMCIVAVKLPSQVHQAQFQGQTKSKLNNPEVAPLVENITRTLEQQLNEKPSAAQAIINRIVLAAKARAASRAAGQEVRRKIGISHRLTLPGKLADCSSNRPEKTELFIVEGDSAGGSAKQGRDRAFQAVLPLRGKVLNTMNSSAKKVAENKELSNIISALGCGIGDTLRPEKLRYGKVIILTDADADGMHIATLLLAFFFQHMRGLIEAGAIYIGKPPLYGISTPSMKKAANGEAKGGKKKANGKLNGHSSGGSLWAYSDEELVQVIKKNNLRSPKIIRYKGLGEMNPDTLWDTTLNPENRTILRVNIDDQQAVDEALNQLMGADPAPRYRLICDRADQIELDI